MVSRQRKYCVEENSIDVAPESVLMVPSLLAKLPAFDATPIPNHVLQVKNVKVAFGHLVPKVRSGVISAPSPTQDLQRYASREFW